MATCVTLKRSRDWVDRSMSPESPSSMTVGPSSSPTSMITSSSSSPKRHCQGLLAAFNTTEASRFTSSSGPSSVSLPSTSSNLGQSSISSSSSTEAQQIRELLLKVARSRGSASSSSTLPSSSTSTISNPSNANQPHFSLDEVVAIVERLLREKEDHLRREFQDRLLEQYEQFCRFTNDQVKGRLDGSVSYLS